MPFYKDINQQSEEGRRILERLLALRAHLAQEIPPRALDSNLLLATWNIREFDSPAYGERIPEAYYYLAEIVACFDLVAIQEVRKSLHALDRLCAILGGYWKYLVTDVTEGAPGNEERMAFLFDSRKVRLGGLAGELVLPPLELKDANNKTFYQPVTQLARTPFICGFKAGWSRFILATVHILYGEDTANNPRRVEEIRQVAQFLKARTEDETAWSRNLILLGDFNIFDPGDETMTAILEASFVIPDEIKSRPSNALQTKHYDQIAFRVQKDRLDTTGQAGVFNFYETVFRAEDEQVYIPYMGEAYNTTSAGKSRQNKSSYYKTYWRTYQMSDHLPMWVELKD